MNDINRKKNATIEWDKSKEVLKEAEALFQKKMAGGAISRDYYAAFHAAKALLLSQGLEVRSHHGLGQLFSLHFVKTKIFDTKFSRILSKAQKFREEADYSSEFTFSIEDAKERLEEITEFTARIELYLKEK